MKQITCYLDFVSPYAWLALDELPRALEGLSYQVHYKPVLLGALFKHHNNPGPAGIRPKHEWTFRHVSWLGHKQGCGLDRPALHPFNPLPLLRLALTCSDDGSINRFTANAIFRHVWLGGHDALDPARLAELKAQLVDQLRTDAEADNRAKTFLRTNTEDATAKGIFGVPSFEVDGKVFWGVDGLPMLRAYLDGDDWFASGAWDKAAELKSGLAPQ